MASASLLGTDENVKIDTALQRKALPGSPSGSGVLRGAQNKMMQMGSLWVLMRWKTIQKCEQSSFGALKTPEKTIKGGARPTARSD